MSSTQTKIINRDHTLGAAYAVTLDAYDGPLDLLLQLIERNQLDISEVSLCAVTDQYLATLERLDAVHPAALADFLAIATRLLFIKSNSLLPRPGDDEDEEEDAGDALVRQLIEYRRFRQAADELKTRSESGQRVHVRPPVPKKLDQNRAAPPDLSDVSAEDLQTVLASVLKRIPVEPPPPRVVAYQVTLSEQVQRIRELVLGFQHSSAEGRNKTRVLFSEVLGSAYTRTEVIVTFLAILELIKQEELTVQQDATFGEIYLLLHSPVDPSPDEDIAARRSTTEVSDDAPST